MNLLMVFFGLIAIVSAVSVFQSIKDKNVLGIIFSVLAAVVFGWFVIMTVLHQGYPPKLH